ncbi:MAG TPA: hypothetical protein VMV07_16135 [Streptosporangiaceae bacterium]|nr:hypothetical protein [Streptosporangiaceae bacterium]
MSETVPFSDQLRPAVMRRAFLRGGAVALATGAGAALALPGQAEASTASAAAVKFGTSATRYWATRTPLTAPVPPALRSQQALTGAGPEQASTVPLTQGGTTYDMAQEVTWLDSEHFAVGRWDGSLSIFAFESAQYTGPLITTAVNTPAEEGVQMITRLPACAVVTSNDDASLGLWVAPAGQWADLRLARTVSYGSSLGVATSGTWLSAGSPSTLVVGHDSGFVSLWSYNPANRALIFSKSVNLQNPNPVNPFDSHVIYGMATLTPGPSGVVVAGSDDGYVSLIAVPSGNILSQTVFNPSAQRGINSVSVQGNRLLVSNCSVGPDDYNLWYYSIQTAPWGVTLLDKTNLIIDTQRAQVFDFDAIWGSYASGPCWFASTEEGVLWMGTADTGIDVIGYQDLSDRAVGAALAYTNGPGRLAVVIDDLNQFSTGAS